MGERKKNPRKAGQDTQHGLGMFLGRRVNCMDFTSNKAVSLFMRFFPNPT
jgi:hypothetical protein